MAVCLHGGSGIKRLGLKFMSNVIVKLNSNGIRKTILQSDEILSYIEGIAQSKSADGHVESFIGFDRAHAIYPDRKGTSNDREDNT